MVAMPPVSAKQIYQTPGALITATGLQLLTRAGSGARLRAAPTSRVHHAALNLLYLHGEKSRRSLTWRLNTIQGAVTGTAHC